MFYFDFETFLIEPGLQAPPIVCMSYAHDQAATAVVHFNPAHGNGSDILEEVIKSNDTMVAHNAAFEVVCMMAHRPEWTERIFEKLELGQIQCTMVREKLIRIALGDRREGFALDDLSGKYGAAVPDKECPWRLRYGTLWGVPVEQWPDEAVAYSRGDIACREIYLAQERHTDYLQDQHHQMRSSVSLLLTTCRGFQVDLERADALMVQTEAELAEHQVVVLANELARWEKKKGVPVLVKTQKVAKARIVEAYEAMGREPPRKPPSPTTIAKWVAENPQAADAMDDRQIKEQVPGNISTDEDACLASGDPVLKSYTKFGQAGTLRSKVARLQRAGRSGLPIQAGYNVLVATGRTSSRQGKDPKAGEPWRAYGAQMQNLGRDNGTREVFVARPGYAIVSVDYDACEMRTWAQVCKWMLGYSALADILNNPERCPHVEMGARLQGITVAEAYALKGDERKALRGVAKGPNFGLPGGMGAARLMDYCRLGYGVVLTMDRAVEACAVWRQVYPEAQPYLDEIKSIVGRKYGSRTQIRQFVSNRYRGDVGFCDASNGFFQGLAADIAKAAGWRLAKEAYVTKSSPLYGGRPLAFVHDEWLYEIPLDRIHEAGYRMAQVMTDTAHEYCPDVRFTAAPAAMLRWSKKAGDPVLKDGRLIPYEWK